MKVKSWGCIHSSRHVSSAVYGKLTSLDDAQLMPFDIHQISTAENNRSEMTTMWNGVVCLSVYDPHWRSLLQAQPIKPELSSTSLNIHVL